jgi:hypothetical protein
MTVSPFPLALVAVFALLAAPGRGAQPASATPGDVIAIRFTGELPNQKAYSSPGFFLFSGNMTSPRGEVLGTLTHEAVCAVTPPPPCLVFDVTSTFDFAGDGSPGGRIVNQAKLSAAPDPQHPGQLLVGIHQPESTIVEMTGVFAGRTGRAQMSGRQDCGSCPEFMTFDDFWLIELD